MQWCGSPLLTVRLFGCLVKLSDNADLSAAAVGAGWWKNKVGIYNVHIIVKRRIFFFSERSAVVQSNNHLKG